MQLKEYTPRTQLVTPQHLPQQPKFPVIDAHNHLFEFGGGWDAKPARELIDRLKQCGVRGYVDLDGGWGEDILEKHLKLFKEPYPDTFQIYGGVNWAKWPEMGAEFPEWAAERLRVQVAKGAQGLKIWKVLGLKVRDETGALAGVGDPRLDPIWHAAAELNLPVLIHIADPVAFFDPIDETNERWEEIGSHPDWAFTSPPGPTFLSLVEGLADLVARNPRTTFVGAHVGCYAENLAWVSDLLDRCPNFYIDPSARIAELGRQPYTARKFFLRYADRILFGLDAGPDLDYYRVCWRFFETEDEYFPYWSNRPGQGRWHIYGIALPDDVLERLYFRNAERVLGFPSL